MVIATLFFNYNINDELLEIIGSFHPLLVHFPIVFCLLALVFDWLYLFNGSKESLRLGNYFLITSGLLMIPIIIAGFAAAIPFRVSRVATHEGWALWTAFFGVVYAIVRCAVWHKGKEALYKSYSFLTLILFLMIGVTADLGGTISHDVTPASLIYQYFYPNQDGDQDDEA